MHSPEHDKDFTLIAYKNDGFEISMGCTMGTFGSDFKLFTKLTLDECVNKHAEITLIEIAEQEPEYDINVLYQGALLAEADERVRDLYARSLNVEIDRQKAVEEERLAQALRERQQSEEQRAARKREEEVQTFLRNAEKLGFNVMPK